MLNSSGASSFGSYSDLRGSILKRLRAGMINEQLLGALRSAYEQALAAENVVLSRPERKRLMTEVLKSVLADLNRQVEEGAIRD